MDGSRLLWQLPLALVNQIMAFQEQSTIFGNMPFQLSTMMTHHSSYAPNLLYVLKGQLLVG